MLGLCLRLAGGKNLAFCFCTVAKVLLAGELNHGLVTPTAVFKTSGHFDVVATGQVRREE